ncbi:MAG TPA: condensation domain-containing protein, partial [Longimicrobium sp.]|nr:condensation domain-containing protein [Longimicrobium sp.]
AGPRDGAPRTPVEEVLAGLWAEVLRLDAVGADDDFFARGGHSLLAMRVLSRVREVFGVELPVRAIFEHPTVAGTARRVEALRRAGLPVLPPVVPVERAAPPPLSFAQERLWFVDQLEGTGALYNIPVARRLRGALDVDALERALGEVVRRHEALRTTFREADGALAQVIAPFAGFALPLEDLSALAATERETEVARRAAEDAARPFDLAAGPVLRARLLRLDRDEHVLLLCLHHVAGDGWSLDVLFRELGALYEAFREGAASPLPDLPVQYADYAAWHRALVDGEALERQLAYWRAWLAGAPELLELPTDHPRPAAPTHRGARERTELPAALAERLRALGRGEGATLYMVLLAAFQVLLAKYAGTGDVVVGTPISGRPRRELEELIGYFANTLALRTELGGDPTFREVLRRVRTAVLDAHEHQDLPFERLVAELKPGRAPGHSPLFQVTFTLRDGEADAWSLPGVRADPVETEARVAKFDLLLAMEADPRALRCGLTYATDLFERDTARRMLRHLARVLEQVAEDADAPVARIRLLDEAERARLLEEGGRKDLSPPPRERIHARFEARAERTPRAVAVTCAGDALTYAELNARANRLAHRLRALGVGPGTRVGLALERSTELVAAILAVLKAGGAYVPLDPAYPADRVAFVLDDAEVPVLITARDLLPRLPSFGGAVLCVDDPGLAAESGANPGVEMGTDALAYVIYTSGSTGRPKGVLVTHANVVRLFDATRPWFEFGEGDVWTLFHSCAFDFSVWEIFGALATGARLVVVPGDVARAPTELAALIDREGVTVLNQTPSAFHHLAACVALDGRSLRYVLFGGEALEPRRLADWFARHGETAPRLVNLYGITETTVHVTVRPITREDVGRDGSPVGVPLPGWDVTLVDD